MILHHYHPNFKRPLGLGKVSFLKSLGLLCAFFGGLTGVVGNLLLMIRVEAGVKWAQISVLLVAGLVGIWALYIVLGAAGIIETGAGPVVRASGGYSTGYAIGSYIGTFLAIAFWSYLVYLYSQCVGKAEAYFMRN